jgi:predicted nucleotidyltransferase
MKDIFLKYVNGVNVTLIDYLLGPRQIKSATLFTEGRGDNNRIDLNLELYKNKLLSLNFKEMEFCNIVSILLQGSYSSNDQIDFSDFDIIVILNNTRNSTIKEIRSDVGQLKKILKKMYYKDPLMHHGFLFINLSDLSSYSEFYLPLDVISTAKVLWGRSNLTFLTLVKRKDEKTLKRLSGHIEGLLYFDFLSRPLMNDYILKYHISSILLFPVIYLSSKDKYILKEKSFDYIYTNYPDLHLDAVKLAEDIRLEWRRPKVSIIHLLSVFLLCAKGQKISKKVYNSNFIFFKFRLEKLRKEVKLLSNSIKN